MIYVTGDTHGNFSRIKDFYMKQNTSKEDIIIVLGDVGINYHGDIHDVIKKKVLYEYPITFLNIHGNHENRPENIDTYMLADFMGGQVYIEPEFPNLIFAKDGEIYNLDNKKLLVIGGAYSFDKQFRLATGGKWWKDEQPSEDIKRSTINKLEQNQWKVDIILSHTCPYKYIPLEAFKNKPRNITTDNSTELWLDYIEDKLDYDKWYCGHWHINKKIDRMRFLYDDIITLTDF